MSANVFKKGAVWHYRFQVAGQRVQKSTRLRSRTAAEKLADEAYRAAVTRANGGQPVPTLAELAHAWIVKHRPVSSEAHIKSVETCARLHFYGLGDKRVSEITTDDIEAARIEHLQTHRPSSANHWLRIMKLLTMWAVKRGILDKSPWTVSQIKVQKRPRAVLAVDIARVWFDAIDQSTKRQPAMGTAIRLMFGLGLREAEAAGARWEWIDWQRSTYTPGVTKGREAEPVPMPAWLTAHLARHRKASGLIAPRANGSTFPAGFARKAMGVANAACAVEGITPHRLRGTFATLLSEAGVPIQTIQKVMRHKSPLTTMGYLEKNLDKAFEAQQQIGQKTGLERRESGAAHQSEPVTTE